MQDIEISQSPLKSINPIDYTISIRLLPGGFCFALYHRQQQQFTTLYRKAANSVADVVTQCEAMGVRLADFGQVNLLDDCKKWTLAPLHIEGLDIKAIWKLNFGSEPQTSLNKSAIAPANALCLFEPSGKALQLKEMLPQANLYPLQAADIAYTIQGSLVAKGNFMGIDVRDKQVNIYLANMGKLQLANAYNVETDTDILYFVMNTVRIFQLSQTDTTLELWGDLAPETINLIGQYMKRVSIAKPYNRFDYMSAIKKLDNIHEYYDLFNIAICAL